MAEELIRAWEGQEVFRLTLRTYIDFTTYAPSAQIIEYIDQDSNTGFYTATAIIGTDGDVYFDFSPGTPVPAKGIYLVRALVTLAGGDVPTDPKQWHVGNYTA